MRLFSLRPTHAVQPAPRSSDQCGAVPRGAQTTVLPSAEIATPPDPWLPSGSLSNGVKLVPPSFE
jgi:hypothetical protein